MGKVMIVSAAANMIWQFNRSNIEILLSQGHEVVVATNFVNPGTITESEVVKLKEWLDDHHVKWYQVDFKRGLGSFKLNFKVINKLRSIIRSEKVGVIHSQSPIGGVLGRIAGKLENKKNIYTAHGFHFFRGAPIRYWLFFYPIEYLLSFITDVEIVINNEDLKRAKRFHAKSLFKINGVGVDLQKQLKVSDEEKTKARIQLREKFGLSNEDFMILNVGELSKRKNQQVIVRAIAKLNDPHVHLFIAGIGRRQEELEQLSKSLDISGQVHFLGYRNDVEELHFAADVNVFSSLQEGLALGGLESVVDGLYLIGADTRGIRDYILDSSIGTTFSPLNVDQLSEKIRFFKLHSCRVQERDIKKLATYDSASVNKKMSQIYSLSI